MHRPLAESLPSPVALLAVMGADPFLAACLPAFVRFVSLCAPFAVLVRVSVARGIVGPGWRIRPMVTAFLDVVHHGYAGRCLVGIEGVGMTL